MREVRRVKEVQRGTEPQRFREPQRVGDIRQRRQVPEGRDLRGAARRAPAWLLARVWLCSCAVIGAACSTQPAREQAPAPSNQSSDAQHQGITTPHGDHTPHHGGLVLMNGDLHYEVVLDANGAHRLWFSDAVREDLPASIARDVRMVVTRVNEPAEALALEIDDAGESWVARGKPVSGDGVMVKLSYVAQGSPHEVEIPFITRN